MITLQVRLSQERKVQRCWGSQLPTNFQWTSRVGEASSRPKDEASQEGAASKPKVLGDYSQRYICIWMHMVYGCIW